MPDPFREISQEEARALLPLWDAGEFVGLPGERGGTANPSAAVDTTTGRVFLRRRNPRYSEPEMLAHDHALMEHLASREFPAPLALESRAGRRWAEVEGDVFELNPYMPGEKHDPTSHAQIAAAGKALAKFHAATDDFTPPPGKEWPRYHDPRTTVEALDWALTELGMTDAQRGEVERLRRLAGELSSQFGDGDYAGARQGTVHGDWHPANVKYAGDEVAAAFDLDWATRQPLLVDIADGVMFFAGVRKTELDGGDIRSLTQGFALDEERMGVFLRAYADAVGSGDPTYQTPELAMLGRFMLARWLYCRADPMRRKIPREEAVEYLLDGVWGPIDEIRQFDGDHTAVYRLLR